MIGGKTIALLNLPAASSFRSHICSGLHCRVLNDVKDNEAARCLTRGAAVGRTTPFLPCSIPKLFPGPQNTQTPSHGAMVQMLPLCVVDVSAQ
jgi:hypothetical protein